MKREKKPTRYSGQGSAGSSYVYLAPLGLSFKLLLVGMGLAMLLFTTVFVPLHAARIGKPVTPPEMWILGGATAAVMMVGLLIPITKTRLTVQTDGVEIVNSAVYRRKLRYGRITEVRVGPVTGLLQGAGLRPLGKGHTGYIAGGPTVTFVLSSGEIVTTSCPEPDAVVALVRPRLGKLPHGGTVA